MMQAKRFAAHAKSHKSPGTTEVRRFEKNLESYAKVFDFDAIRARGDVCVAARKRSYSDEELGDGILSKGRRKFSDDFLHTSDPDELKIQGLKAEVEEIYKYFKSLTKKLDKKDNDYNEEVKILFARLDLIDIGLGTRSSGRTDSFEVPTLWGSVALMGEAMDDVKRDIKLFPSSSDLRKSLLHEFNRIENNAVETVREIKADLEERVAIILSNIDLDTKEFKSDVAVLSTKLKTNVASLSTDLKTNVATISLSMKTTQDDNDAFFVKLAEGAFHLKNELGALQNQVRSGSLHPVSAPTSSSNCSNYVQISTYDADTVILEGEMKAIRSKISKLVSDIDGEAIKSFGMGFCD